MLDVIIYEDNEVSIKKNIRIINMLFVNSNIDYHMHIFRKCDEELIRLISDNNAKKIFIINIETDNNSGIKIASMIRENGLDNIIILTARCNKYYNEIFDKKIMAYDYVCKCDNYEIRIMNDINYILNIIYRENTLIFKYKNTLYRIPFKDINYIEKEANIKRCIIHALDKSYYIVCSIDKLFSMFNIGFIKTHQSCIVNTNNIKVLDCINNIIVFNNDSYTSLVTDRAKKEIKKIVFNNRC